MVDLVRGAYNHLTRNKSFPPAVALTWSNVPRTTIEQLTGTDPAVSANSMIYATGVKIIFGPIYEHCREKAISYLEKKGFIKGNDPNNGRKTFDRLYGPTVALFEGSINTAAYLFVYGEQNFKRALLNGFASALTTSFGNFNGKAIDTMLELNNLPNEGRGFVSKNTSLERKTELKHTIEALAVGFPAAYYLGTQLATLLS